MNASIRTLIYASVAIVFAGLAYATHQAMQPADLSGFDLVGQEFYENFREPEKAARLRVAAYDALREEPQVFSVEKHGDSWRIPSHHDYPAEAKERLAETAASVNGVTREAVASRRPADHERYGVIDPLDEDSTAIRGRGRRITLYDENGKELVDLIIGEKVEGQADQYYVRAPDEKEVYRSTLDVKLSTRFSDWIDPDLLKLTASDLVAIESTRPVIEKQTVDTPFGPRLATVLTGTAELQLEREGSSDDWTLTGIEPATEELKTEPISDAVTSLDNLKLVGVRPKPRGINADFTIDLPEDVRQNPQLRQQVLAQRRDELSAKGFDILTDREGRLQLFTMEGNLAAATSDGVVYTLHFGSRFTGSLDEIEFGGDADADAEEAATDDAESENSETEGTEKPADDESTEAESSDTDESTGDEEDDSGTQTGRYVLVAVAFDPAYIGEPPVAPVEPEKPASLETPEEPKSGEQGSSDDSQPEEPAAPDTEASEEDPAEQEIAPADANEQSPAEGKPDDKKADDKKSADETSTEKSDAEKKSPEQLAYEQALQEYEISKAEYDRKKEDYDNKVKEGEEHVEQLNKRFKGWYYVISNESFETLRLIREDLVSQKEPSQPKPVQAPTPANAEPDESDDAK